MRAKRVGILSRVPAGGTLVRGKRSGRVIQIGGKVSEDDGDLEVTVERPEGITIGPISIDWGENVNVPPAPKIDL